MVVVGMVVVVGSSVGVGVVDGSSVGGGVVGSSGTPTSSVIVNES